MLFCRFDGAILPLQRRGDQAARVFIASHQAGDVLIRAQASSAMFKRSSRPPPDPSDCAAGADPSTDRTSLRRSSSSTPGMSTPKPAALRPTENLRIESSEHLLQRVPRGPEGDVREWVGRKGREVDLSRRVPRQRGEETKTVWAPTRMAIPRPGHQPNASRLLAYRPSRLQRMRPGRARPPSVWASPPRSIQAARMQPRSLRIRPACRPVGPVDPAARGRTSHHHPAGRDHRSGTSAVRSVGEQWH